MRLNKCIAILVSNEIVSSFSWCEELLYPVIKRNKGQFHFGALDLDFYSVYVS